MAFKETQEPYLQPIQVPTSKPMLACESLAPSKTLLTAVSLPSKVLWSLCQTQLILDLGRLVQLFIACRREYYDIGLSHQLTQGHTISTEYGVIEILHIQLMIDGMLSGILLMWMFLLG